MEERRAGRGWEGNENTIESGRDRVFSFRSLSLVLFPSSTHPLRACAFPSLRVEVRYTHTHTRTYVHTKAHLPVPCRRARNGWPDFRAVGRRTNVAMARLKLRVFARPFGIRLYGVFEKISRAKTMESLLRRRNLGVRLYAR